MINYNIITPEVLRSLLFTEEQIGFFKRNIGYIKNTDIPKVVGDHDGIFTKLKVIYTTPPVYDPVKRTLTAANGIYTFDEKGLLIRFDPLDGKWVKYGYNDYDRMISLVNKDTTNTAWLWGVTEEDKDVLYMVTNTDLTLVTVTTYDKDEHGIPIALSVLKDKHGYLGKRIAPNVYQYVDYRGYKYVTTYKDTLPIKTTGDIDFVKTYDHAGRVLTHKSTGATPHTLTPVPVDITMTYDTLGNLTSIHSKPKPKVIFDYIKKPLLFETKKNNVSTLKVTFTP